MEPNEIRAHLMLNNVRVSDIARSLSLPHSNVTVVITGKRPNPRVRAAIAKAIKKPESEIWPETAKEEGN